MGFKAVGIGNGVAGRWEAARAGGGWWAQDTTVTSKQGRRLGGSRAEVERDAASERKLAAGLNSTGFCISKVRCPGSGVDAPPAAAARIRVVDVARWKNYILTLP